MRNTNCHSVKPLLLVFLCLTFALIAVGGAFLISNNRKERNYSACINEGNKYMEQLKFEEAVTAFELAIKKNPKDETTYIKIYQIRDLQGEHKLARSMLEIGYKNTKSERIDYLLRNYLEKYGDETDGMGKQEELQLENLSAYLSEIKMNVPMLQKLESFTYADYEREFGRCISHERRGEAVEIVHANFLGTFLYQNTKEQTDLISMEKGLPLQNAKPVSVRLQNLAIIFQNYKDGITYKRLCELIGMRIDCTYLEEADSYVDTFTYGNCKMELGCDKNGDIVQGTVWNRITLPESKDMDEKGNASGVIINAVTGAGIENARLNFVPNMQAAEPIRVECDEQGAYEVELPEGKYEVEVMKEGFITDRFQLEIASKEQKTGESFPLSPKLENGEIRIVMTWGTYPRDLDSHLEGTIKSEASQGNHNFHIYYGNKEDSLGKVRTAVLDVDNRNGFGPETTTIFTEGSYHFWVEDFQHSGHIGESQASVKVYMPNETAPVEFHVPNQQGNTWDIFTIEDGKISTIDKVI